jgi:hypothetical protein
MWLESDEPAAEDSPALRKLKSVLAECERIALVPPQLEMEKAFSRSDNGENA